MNDSSYQRLIVRNLLSPCCFALLRKILQNFPVEIKENDLGIAEIIFQPEMINSEVLVSLLKSEGFEILVTREEQLVEQIKHVITQLIQHNTENSMIKFSDFLVEKFNMSYQYLSTLFSRYERSTLEKFIIQKRIEKVKELLQQNDLSLSEIAYLMGYSSVQYLSAQFRKITGMTVSEYKKLISYDTES